MTESEIDKFLREDPGFAELRRRREAFLDLKSQEEIDEEEQISAAHRLGVVVVYLMLAWIIGCGLFIVLIVR